MECMECKDEEDVCEFVKLRVSCFVKEFSSPYLPFHSRAANIQVSRAESAEDQFFNTFQYFF